MPGSDADIDLPGALGDIADVAGKAAALKIAHVKGGQEAVYIPTPDALDKGAAPWLVEAVGIDAARLIAKRMGGGPVPIPLGPFAGVIRTARLRMIREMEQGASAARAARLAGFTERSAWRHKARLKPAHDDLFAKGGKA